MVQWDNRTYNLATGNSWRAYLEDDQTWSFRGSKSRNKVSVGEPAEGSLLVSFLSFTWVVNEQNLACEVCVHSQIELDLKLLVSTTSNCVLKFVLSRNMLYSWTDYDCVVKNIKNYWKILSGGSLGSYVDEGRSKMREIVWIAGHIEHRYSERKLQCKACLCTTPVGGSLLNHSTLCV